MLVNEREFEDRRSNVAIGTQGVRAPVSLRKKSTDITFLRFDFPPRHIVSSSKIYCTIYALYFNII